MNEICEKLQTIGMRIREAEARYGRETGSVQLLAVSKLHPVGAIEQAMTCGQVAFGENYAKEMIEKAEVLVSSSPEWHFIGPMQSNKTRIIAETADWVHSVDRLKIAQRLNDQRPEGSLPLSVCVQVNISAEDSKSGLMAGKFSQCLKKMMEMPNLKVRGLMAIPAATSDVSKQRQAFSQLRELQESMNQQGFALDTLSMGMTGDMEAAIAEGATIVKLEQRFLDKDNDNLSTAT